MFFSSLFFGNSKRNGRSFGRITVRHRGSGFSIRKPVLFNFQLFLTNSYVLSRFCFFSPIFKSKFINIFSFSKSFNKVLFNSQMFYESFNSFCSYINNKRFDFPSKVMFSDTLFSKYITQKELFDEESDYVSYSPYETNFFNVVNGCYIKDVKTPPFYKPMYSVSFFSYSRFIRKLGFTSFIRLSSTKIITVSTFSAFNFFGYGERPRSTNPFVLASNAGSTRRRGIRPTVRGVAINPVDHPHGGRTGESRHSVSPWAQLTKGFKTVRYKKLCFI
jgi:hypothetical protein